MLKWDGFDRAIIGVGERNNTDSMIVYDYDKQEKHKRNRRGILNGRTYHGSKQY